MKRNTILYILVFLVTAILVIPAVSHAQLDSTKATISAKKFNRLSHKSNTVVIDVRTPEEYAAGHIPGAINIDVKKDSSFMQQIQGLDQSKRYLLYCHSGRRSAKALHSFNHNGFATVYHLKGGIEQWNGVKETGQPGQ